MGINDQKRPISSRVDVMETPPELFSKKDSKSCIWVERQNFYCVQDQKNDNAKAEKPKPKLKSRKKTKLENEPFLLIGFDTEFKTPNSPLTREELADGKGKYDVLSYQFHCRMEDGREWTGICCPEPGQRMSLGEFLIFALGKGVQGGIVDILPTRIYLVGHFTRADVPAFLDFRDLTDNLMNVRNTFISEAGYIPFDILFHDNPKNQNKTKSAMPNNEVVRTDSETVRLKVTLRDTMLLSPGNSKSLAEIGDLVGQPKIILDSDSEKERHLKSNMDIVRRDNWELFKRYAMNDATICVRYAEKVIALNKSLTGSPRGVLPITLTSIGVELLDKTWKDTLDSDRLQLVGKEAHKETRFDKKRGFYRPHNLEVDLEQVHWHIAFITECYHGGRNEQFWFGPGKEDDWFDYDLSSAYPTAMSLIGKPDWKNVKYSNDLEEIIGSTLGFACVDFEFPETVRFPTLPVRSDNGLVFPRKGRSYCCSPELSVAKELGAQMSVCNGCVVPTDDNSPVFGHFIKHCLDQRQKYPKGSLDNLFWKELANSTYGKTAQGLRERRVYDMRDRSTKPLPPSKITNPFFAAFITSFVRAILGEIINLLPSKTIVFSCTTDGFLTSANTNQINKATAGKLAKVYRNARFKLTGKKEVLEVKHQIRQPLGWKTRGQATLKPGQPNAQDKNFHIVLAKSGIYTGPLLDTDELENDYITELFFNRTVDTKIQVTALTGIRDMIEIDTDLVAKQIEKRLNMEFDWKRRPLNVHDSGVKGHVAFATAPWETIDDFLQTRQLWTQYNQRNPICIKTMEDFRSFSNFVETASLSNSSNRKYLRTSGGVSPDITRLRQAICTAWHHGGGGFTRFEKERYVARTFADLLTNVGVPCKKTDVENARRKQFVPHRVPRTNTCIDAINRLKTVFTSLDVEIFLTEPHKTLQFVSSTAK
jgi:hypothetical protein